MRWEPLLWHKLTIRRKRWRVLLASEDVAPELGENSGVIYYGFADPKERVLLISAAQPVDGIRNTWFHEVLHALTFGTEAWPAHRLVDAIDAEGMRLFSSMGLEPPPMPHGWRTLQRHALAVARERKRRESCASDGRQT